MEERKGSSDAGVVVVVMVLMWLCIVAGFILSVYAMYVEHKAELDEQYEALCDVSARVSCTKVFRSEYGHIFLWLGLVSKGSLLDMPNAVFGAIYYIAFAAVYRWGRNLKIGKCILLLMSSLTMSMCALLSYALAVVLRDQCIVCFATYAVNFVLFVGTAML